MWRHITQLKTNSSAHLGVHPPWQLSLNHHDHDAKHPEDEGVVAEPLPLLKQRPPMPQFVTNVLVLSFRDLGGATSGPGGRWPDPSLPAASLRLPPPTLHQCVVLVVDGHLVGCGVSDVIPPSRVRRVFFGRDHYLWRALDGGLMSWWLGLWVGWRVVSLSVVTSRHRCPGNRRNAAFFGFAAAVRFNEVSPRGAEAAQGLHDPTCVLTGTHGDLSKGIAVPAVDEWAGLSMFATPISVPIPLHRGGMGGVKEGVVDWGVVTTKAVLGTQAGRKWGAGGVQGIGDGWRQRLGSGGRQRQLGEGRRRQVGCGGGRRWGAAI